MHSHIKQHNLCQNWISEMFCEQQISILECFLKDLVTLKPGVMVLEIQLALTVINYQFNFKNISQCYCYYWVYFNQINAALVSIRDL